MAQSILGNTYGNLTVIEKTTQKRNRSFLWLCFCICGNTTKVISSNLKSGHTKSCGCLWKNNLIGKKFGKWTVLEKTAPTKYIAKCECGTIKEVFGTTLKTGKSSTCGCSYTGANSRFYKHGKSYTKEYIANKNALRRAATSEKVSFEELSQKISNLNKKCVYCQEGSYEELDHIIPIVKGGKHTIENIVPSCFSCNRSKGAKILGEWMPSNPVEFIRRLY